MRNEKHDQINIFIFVSLIVLITNVSATFAGIPKEYLLVRSPNVRGCTVISDTDTCFDVSWGKAIRITESQAKERSWEKDKWFKVITRKKNNSFWWIESKYLILNSELKKVSKKWPVRYLYFNAGDYRYLFDFEKDGSVVYRKGNRVIGKGNVFIGPEDGYQVLEIRYPEPVYNKIAIKLGFNPKALSTTINCNIRTGDLCAYATIFDKRKPVYDSNGKCLVDCPSEIPRNKQ